MARQSFGDRWELDPAQRDAACAIVEGVISVERMIAGLEAIKASLLGSAQALALEVMAEMDAPSRYQLPIRAIAADIATATHISEGTVRSRMDESAVLIEQFPATYTALCDGVITRAHAAVVVAEGIRLTGVADRRRYESVVLPRAAETTSALLRPIAQAVAERIEPTSFVERHRAARAQRRTWVDELGDGMSELHLVAESALVHGAQDRIGQMAASIQRAARSPQPSAFGSLVDELEPEPKDERTLAQIRADVATDLLLTGHPTAEVSDATGGNALASIKATVQITIPADTITGIGDDAAFLAGHGPISADVARRLAAGAHTWTRLFIDPDTGCLAVADAYTPTAAQKRFLVARDEHCRFPGCRQPIRRCDVDHTIPYSDGGPTSVENTSHLCRAHHVLKHNSAWRFRHLGGGVIEATTPTGRVITDHPASVVRFVAELEAADPDPPPEPAADDAPF
ncbi:HNH endonuclease signature motif containing protein [Microbacterium paludicola]|uniref:HNH endonuclease signature motif containing protein n=1 Tax=Microbacterium paludicola TaxID=300019 RepID=UPI0031DE4994